MNTGLTKLLWIVHFMNGMKGIVPEAIHEMKETFFRCISWTHNSAKLGIDNSNDGFIKNFFKTGERCLAKLVCQNVVTGIINRNFSSAEDILKIVGPLLTETKIDTSHKSNPQTSAIGTVIVMSWISRHRTTSTYTNDWSLWKETTNTNTQY